MRSLAGYFTVATLLVTVPAVATEAPRYKPSSSARTMDILTDAYGYSRSAPNALRLGERVPDFVAPRAGGGHVALATLRAKGPVVVIFYRGHW